MLRKFVKDLLIYLPSKFLPALTGLITAPILTRILLPVEYGNWALALGVSDFLFALACSGIGAGAIRLFPAYKTRSQLGVFFVSILITTGITIAVFSGISFLALALFHSKLPQDLVSLLPIGILIFMFQSVFTIFSEIARAQNRSGLYTWINLSVNYGSLGLGLFLVIVAGMRVEGLMWATLGVTIIVLPFLLRTTIRGVSLGRKNFRTSDIFSLWQYAWPLALGNMAFWGLRLSDRFIISFLRSGSEAGIYSAIYNLSDRTINILVALFLLSMGPMVNTIWEEQGKEATEKTVKMITRVFLIVCLPAAIGLSVLATPFTTILTGSAYHEGYRIVGYIAFAGFAYGLSQIASRGTLIAKDTRKIGINFIVAAIVNFGLNILLVPRFGYFIAGVTTLIGYILLVVLQAISSRPYLNWQFPYLSLLRVVGASTVMGLVAWGTFAISSRASIGSFASLMLSIAVAVFIYIAVLWLAGEINREEKLAVLQVFHTMTGRIIGVTKKNDYSNHK